MKYHCGRHATAKQYAPHRAHTVLLRHGLGGRPSPARPAGLRPPTGRRRRMRVPRAARLDPDRGPGAAFGQVRGNNRDTTFGSVPGWPMSRLFGPRVAVPAHRPTRRRTKEASDRLINGPEAARLDGDCDVPVIISHAAHPADSVTAEGCKARSG